MRKALLMTCGFIALALGAVGAVLPVMPTTPFVLLAAVCFGSSSPSLYHKLKNTKYFGEFIDNYHNKTGVRQKVKTEAIAFLWIMLIISAFISQKPLVMIILLAVGIGVTIHIITIKKKK